MILRKILKECCLSPYSRVVSIRLAKRWTGNSGSFDEKGTNLLKDDLSLPGIKLEEIEALMTDDSDNPISGYYPKLNVFNPNFKSIQGHNLVVIQPWLTYNNLEINTDADIQLDECVSLGNTIKDWQVIGKKVIYTRHTKRKHIFSEPGFEEFKDLLATYSNATAVFFGVEVLSGVQLSAIEKELKMPVYDRFTMVLNIFRQHARTKEAKIQVALAELPYIKSHLREIHDSSDSSSAESLKLLVGGSGQSFYHRRLDILRKREHKLRTILVELKKQRDTSRRLRKKQEIPTVSVVGYTNSGKTSLIKYMTHDEDMCPKDQLFATLDVSAHQTRLPLCGKVLFIDTVGFISRVPLLLVEAFESTLRDIQDSNLIIHVLDVTHPDHRLQYDTVVKALNSLNVPRKLLTTKLTVGNKVDLVGKLPKFSSEPHDSSKCNMTISCIDGTNMQQLAGEIDSQLKNNLGLKDATILVENGGPGYAWLRKNASIIECVPDETDANYLHCRVVMSKAAIGRWRKFYGIDNVMQNRELFEPPKKQLFD